MNSNLIAPFPLVDAPVIKEVALSKESYQLRKKCSDLNESLASRVEIFQDIMSMDIGDTPLTRLRNIEREYGARQLYAKFEGGNPTGTQKDRIAFAQCHDALRREYSEITVATCGNYGASISVAAFLSSLRCNIFIPKSYRSKRIDLMEKYGAKVIRVEGSYEDAVEYSTDMAKKKDWYDANPGGLNTSLQLLAYAEIANEIYDVLRDAPKYVAAPVSNGTLLAGVYRGFVTLFKRGRTSRIPIMIAGSSAYKNPIVFSHKRQLKKGTDLDPNKIKETAINEPLVNWHSFDGDEALNAIRVTHGNAFDISDERLLKLTSMLRDKEGLRVLPAATAGLAAMLEHQKKEHLEPDRYVAIITGRK